MQRIPLNRLLIASYSVLSWPCIMDAGFLDFGGLPEIGNFPLQLPLELAAFWFRAWGGTSGGLFSRIFVDYPKSTISLHSIFYKIQRIPFNRLLTALMKALFQQALVEQM